MQVMQDFSINSSHVSYLLFWNHKLRLNGDNRAGKYYRSVQELLAFLHLNRKDEDSLDNMYSYQRMQRPLHPEQTSSWRSVAMISI